MPGIISPRHIQEMAYAVHEEVVNRRNPTIADRQAYPWWSFLLKRRAERTFIGGKLIHKMQRDGGLEEEHWDGRQVLTFQENEVDVETTFSPRRTHIGLELAHTEIEDLGYTVDPNMPRDKDFAKKLPKADADRIMDLIDMKLEDMMDAWDTRLDRTFLLDGTQKPLAPLGLAAFLPEDNTFGTFGGQPRTDPLFQHHVALGLTYGVGDTLERGMHQTLRNCHRNNRGSPSRVDFIMAGEAAIDRYVSFAKANGMPYERNAGTQAASRVDIGIPDSAIHYQNIPIVHNPTFEYLDSRGEFGGAIPWTRKMLFLSSSTWTFGYAANKFKHFSAPMDPADQRLTRLSLDGRHCLYCTKINGNGLVSVVD